MNEKRPINLNVFKYRFPAPAIASILHRISGFLVFLLLPFLLWILDESLYSPARYSQLQSILVYRGIRLAIWCVLSALLYHLVAGIRHMLMDIGFGESKTMGRMSAYATMIISAALIIWAGCWLW